MTPGTDGTTTGEAVEAKTVLQMLLQALLEILILHSLVAALRLEMHTHLRVKMLLLSSFLLIS